jgi:hypothetical protein
MPSPRSGYERLTDEPVLRPPSRETIDSYRRAATQVRNAGENGAHPPRVVDSNGRGQRLFDAAPGDATDYAGFCAGLKQTWGGRGLKDARATSRAASQMRQARLLVIALAATQAVGAAVFAYVTLQDPASGNRDISSHLTSSLILASGCVGLVGGLRRSPWALQAYFMSQIWALAVTFAQWLRSQQQAGRTSLFCGFRAATADDADCSAVLDSTTAGVVVLVLAAVYGSMFATDMLAEGLQDQLELEDQLSLIRFSWLMHRKTLVGVQRFEDVVHTRFKELVSMGFLKLRPTPSKAL